MDGVESMKRAWLALALGAFLAGCGETRQDGGSNTNWLSACETDSDCPDGGEC